MINKRNRALIKLALAISPNVAMICERQPEGIKSLQDASHRLHPSLWAFPSPS